MKRRLALTLALASSAQLASGAAAQTIGQQDSIGFAAQTAVEASLTAAAANEASASALAIDEPATDASGSDWNVSFTPYLWVAGVHGDIGIPRNDEEVEVDQSFADLLANLKFGFMGALDIEHRRFVMVSDIMYMNIGVKAESVNHPGFESKVGTKMFVGSALAGYRVVDQGPMFVDLFVGGRLTSIDIDFKLTGPLGNTIERGTSPSRVAPLIGGRVRVPLGKKWGLGLYTDFGGIGGSSDVRWQLVGTVQRDLGEHWRMLLGYRHMHLKHSKSDAAFDMDLSGPLLGFSYRF